MSLVVKKTDVINYPKRLLIYGVPKAGKSTALANLSDNLIIDTEDGYGALQASIFPVRDYMRENNANMLMALGALYQELTELNPYKYITFDTIDIIEAEISKIVCSEEGVEDISDLAYGKGWSLVRERILKMLDSFQSLGVPIILVGHRKLTVAADANIVKMSDISLTGKLKDMIFSSCDAIGYAYRERDESGVEYFYLSFVPSADDSIIAGSRIDRLNGQIIPISKKEAGELYFNWEQIYPKEK